MGHIFFSRFFSFIFLKFNENTKIRNEISKEIVWYLTDEMKTKTIKMLKQEQQRG